MLEADKNEQELIFRALDEWEREGRIDAGLKEELKKSVTLRKSDVQLLAKYFFIIAASCTLLAFAAIFIDDKLLERIRSYFSLGNMVIAVIMSLLSVAWFWYVQKKKAHFSAAAYEVFLILGGLISLTALVYFYKDLDQVHYSYAALFASVLLFALGIRFRSVSLWTGGLLALCGWFGGFTTWHSRDNLFLGMNYPVRFAVFGMVLMGLAWLQKHVPVFRFTQRISFIFSLIVLFTALWGVSVFGNYADLSEWSEVRQATVLIYAFVFAAAAAAAFFLGLRKQDDFARDTGIVFLLINLYTRYFEYFWDHINKGIFFLVLALSFWLLGRWVERRKRNDGQSEK